MHAISRRHLLASGATALAIAPWSAGVQGSAGLLAASGTDEPPPTPVRPVVDDYFGTRITDRYRWMEARPASAEWTGWLKAQDDFARARLAALPQQAAMAARIKPYLAKIEGAGPPTAVGGRLFITRFQPEISQARRLFWREGDDGPEKLLIDPVAERGKVANIDFWRVSPTGRHVAYGLSDGGSEITSSYVRDVAGGEVVKVTDISSRVCGWDAAGTGFFYYRLRKDAVFGAGDYRKGGSTWYHRLGTDPATDLEVFRSGEGEGLVPQESDTPFASGAPGSRWIVGAHMLNDDFPEQIFVAPAADVLAGKARWRRIVGRDAGAQQWSLVGDTVYVLANKRRSNGEIVAIDAGSGDFATARVLVPAGDAPIDGFATGREGLFVRWRRNNLGELARVGFDGTATPIKPPTRGGMWGQSASRDRDGVWFGMDDLTDVPSIWYAGKDLAAKRLVLAPPPPFDTNGFTTTRVEVKARDGAMVPVEILHRADLKRDGTTPMLVIAYGAYGIVMDVGFNPLMLPFLQAGGAIVYAHVRGGGEKGEAWHAAGQKATKANTWRDAIDTGEWLVREKWTTPSRLSLWGTSAGGIMVGRAITERPDLWAAAIGDVGIFDTLRMELTANGPGNDAEFGSVKTAEGFRWLLAQDSVQAIRDGVRYPAVLVLTGANDQRVESWMPGKFAARLQAASSNRPGAILRVDYGGGHGAASVDGYAGQMTDIFAFVLANSAPAGRATAT